MAPPLRIALLFHPESESATALATAVHGALSVRPTGYGPRIPVRFWPVTDDGRPTLGLSLDDAQHTVAVVLADRRMARRALHPEVAEAWGELTVALLAEAASSSRHAVVPVAVDDRAFDLSDALEETSFVRLDFREGRDAERHLLTHVATRALRLLLGREATGATGEPADTLPTAPLRVFLSHAKMDLHRRRALQTSGPVPTLIARLSETPLDGWYDASDIAPGQLFSERIKDGVPSCAALIAVLGDGWSTREWCRAEALLAKQHRRPMLVVDAMTQRTDRLFPYVGNSPTVRWRAATLLKPSATDDQDMRDWWDERWRAAEVEDADEVIAATILEALRHEHAIQRLQQRNEDDHAPSGEPTAVFLGAPPEALTLDHLGPAVTEVWYPDPPLGREELEQLERGRRNTRFLTPLSALADWPRPDTVDAVALSLSGSPDAARYGGSPAHFTQLAEDLALCLLLAGLRLNYGGDINHGGTQPGDKANYVRRLFEMARSHAPLAKEIGASRYHPIINTVAWPIHPVFDDATLDLYGREAILDPRPCPDTLDWEALDLAPLDSGFVPFGTADQRFAWAVGLTEMRRHQVRQTAARIMVAGKLAGSKSRYPGVLEEALESLRADQPLYLLGAFGGATRLVIDALMGHPREELTTDWFRAHLNEAHPAQWDELVARHERFGLAIDTPEELAAFFAERGKDGPAAALRNGLDDAENVELFGCDDPGRVIELVLKGLRARFVG